MGGKDRGVRSNKDSFMKDFIKQKRFKQKVGWSHKHYKRKPKYPEENNDLL